MKTLLIRKYFEHFFFFFASDLEKFHCDRYIVDPAEHEH